MKIEELFRRDINRIIEEVIKVDLADGHVIANEFDEYIATEHILDNLETVINAYQESIHNPNENCTVWVSGFFGSGKSSWAKVLGYLLWNPTVGGQTATDRFFGRTSAPRLRALLNTVHAQSPTLSVLLNLATGSNVVAREGESVVLPVYRALLDRLNYSRNFTLAELEYTMEGDGKLEDFEKAFADIVGSPWQERRYTALAKRDAMKALDAVYGDGSGLPKWARELDAPDIDADWFATRALELLERRGGGARRLNFVVDEAGQYVARSVQRMLDLQGLAEAFQKRRGRLWLVVTSQETLDDVVDSLESKQVELARAQARFRLRVDLLPSDIDEVTGKRVLDKTDEGQRAVREAIAPHRNKLIRNIRLSSPTRSGEPGEDELVRLYPLLPYQIQLLIDAVSVRRTQGGASPTIGGSNRTLIKHAQQLITHPRYGLRHRGVGALVTLDRSFQLLEELIPTSWRSEVDQVADQYGANSIEVQVMKVTALCVEIPALPLTAENIAALLHPHVAAESQLTDVNATLSRLVADDRLRETKDGYKLQSPEQKDWEQTRRGIGLTRGGSVRLLRQLLRQALGGLTVTRGRAFKIDVSVEGERVVSVISLCTSKRPVTLVGTI
ncbi:MAG: BREX system P-loop protein BrxC [bacterium]|nr:BREX system P-loop protein BrxC [bacterium]